MSLRAIPDAMDPAVVARIDDELDAIAEREGVVILLAIESGSRAWGFPSPDSDYDCRFLYLRSPAAYLALTPPRDVIETPVGPVLDVAGWDLRKALGLMLKGNAVVNEWLTSPILYRGDAAFRSEAASVAARVACRSSMARHYLSMGRSALERFRGGSGPLKKLFYALRPALALEWMAEHPDAAPPMNLQELLDGVRLAQATRAEIAALVARKAQTRELGEATAPANLVALIEAAFDAGERRCESRGFVARGEAGPLEAAANRLFLESLQRFFGPAGLDPRPQF